MPKAFQVMNLMPKYKAPPADIQPSSMGPKWLDCKNHCLKYMSVFLGLLIVLLISSKVWWLFQLPCESSTCVHWSYLCGKVPCLISVDLGLLLIFWEAKPISVGIRNFFICWQLRHPPKQIAAPKQCLGQNMDC